MCAPLGFRKELVPCVSATAGCRIGAQPWRSKKGLCHTSKFAASWVRETVSHGWRQLQQNKLAKVTLQVAKAVAAMDQMVDGMDNGMTIQSYIVSRRFGQANDDLGQSQHHVDVVFALNHARCGNNAKMVLNHLVDGAMLVTLRALMKQSEFVLPNTYFLCTQQLPVDMATSPSHCNMMSIDGPFYVLIDASVRAQTDWHLPFAYGLSHGKLQPTHEAATQLGPLQVQFQQIREDACEEERFHQTHAIMLQRLDHGKTLETHQTIDIPSHCQTGGLECLRPNTGLSAPTLD